MILDIIIEMHSNSDTLSAIQIAKVLEPLRIFYYEEPAHPLNVENFVEIKKKTDMSLASGERIYTRLGYRQFFEKRCLDVIQPDLCLCGGLSEAKKICDMAWAYDAHVQIHVCGSPISKAAALQIEAAIPNFLIHEHHQRALDPVNRQPASMIINQLMGGIKFLIYLELDKSLQKTFCKKQKSIRLQNIFLI